MFSINFKKIIISTLVTLHYFSFSACAKSEGKAASYLLPWEMIAKELCSNSRTCNNKNQACSNISIYPNQNYAYQPDQPVIIRLPAEMAENTISQKTKVNISQYLNNSWQEVGEFSACIEPNEIVLSSGINDEGFFRLQFALKIQGNLLSNFCEYVVISKNWKKDILTFCRALKGEIESNPDSQLIHSSIAVSHCDHTMEIISKTSILSNEVMKALAEAVRSKRDFGADRCPDLVVGLNKIRLKRFEGAKVAEFVVFIPKDYDASQKWPIFLRPDPERFEPRRNYARRSGLVDIWWHFPRYMGFERKDFEYLIRYKYSSVVKSMLSKKLMLIISSAF